MGIEHFINENESYLKSIETVDSIDDFFALEKIKILGALIIAAIGGLLLSNLMIDSSLATLIVGITLTSLSGLYLMNKAYQHGMGFFKKPDDDAVKIQVNPISAS